MASLWFLGAVQIGTAILLPIPGALPLFGLRAPPTELSAFVYFCASLYAAVGLLYVLGALRAEYRKAALIVACFDVVLESASVWLGLPAMGVPTWLSALFCLALLAPGAGCLAALLRRRSA